MLIFIVSYFTTISYEITLIISLILLILSLFIYYFLWKKYDHILFQISFEESPSYYFSIFIISIISYIYLGKTYQDFPFSLPKISIPFIDDEVSFISSVLYGVNSKRAIFFTFKDPNILNVTFSRPTLPLLFAASVISTGVETKDALFFIHFLNVVGASSIIYYFGAIQKVNGLLLVILVMFNGGLGFYKYFFSSNSAEYDFYHDFGFRVPSPIFHLFAHHLSYSLSSSLSIPLAILSLCYGEDSDENDDIHLFGGFLAFLIPNFLTSAAVFLVSLCNKNSVRGFLPFSLTLVFRYFFSDLIVKPIWREFQNEGYRFSQIIILIEMFGPVFLSIFYKFSQKVDKLFFSQFLSSLAATLLLCVFRERRGTFDDSIGINSIFVPIVFLTFSEYIERASRFYRSKSGAKSGAALALIFFCLASVVGSGIVCLINSERNRACCLLSKNDELAGLFIRDNLPPDSFVFARERKFQPASFVSGRQTLIGDPTNVWLAGNSQINRHLNYFRSIDHLENSIDGVMSELNASFLLVNKKDSGFLNSLMNSSSRFMKIYSNKEWMIYKVHP